MSVIGGLALLPALAFADVDIYVTINKDKNIYIDESLKVEKKVDIDVEVELKTKKAAESDTLVNQKNEDNKDSNAFTGSNSVISNVTGSGIVNVNQASGNMNNQANAVSVAVDPGDNNNHHNNHHDRDRFDPASKVLDKRLGGQTQRKQEEFVFKGLLSERSGDKPPRVKSGQ
jgi:ABC-type Na+ efflux pump permease subunit